MGKDNPTRTFIDKEKILELYQRKLAGDTVTLLASEVGVNKSTICRYFQRLEKDKLSSKEVIWESRKKDVIEAFLLWDSGYSLEALSKQYNISVGCLHNLFSKHFERFNSKWQKEVKSLKQHIEKS